MTPSTEHASSAMSGIVESRAQYQAAIQRLNRATDHEIDEAIAALRRRVLSEIDHSKAPEVTR